MGTYRNYLPRHIRTYSSQAAQIGTLISVVLAFVVLMGCISPNISSLYWIRFLVSDQRPNHNQQYEWLNIGTSGQCLHSSLKDSITCDTTRRPYYYEPRGVLNLPITKNMISLLQKGGISISVLWAFAVSMLILGLISGTIFVVYENKRKWTSMVARVSVCLGALCLSAANGLATAIYTILHKNLKDYDNDNSSKSRNDRLVDPLYDDLNQPMRFFPQLGRTTLTLSWIATVAGLIAALCWVNNALQRKNKQEDNNRQTQYYYYDQNFSQGYYHENRF